MNRLNNMKKYLIILLLAIILIIASGYILKSNATPDLGIGSELNISHDSGVSGYYALTGSNYCNWLYCIQLGVTFNTPGTFHVSHIINIKGTHASITNRYINSRG